MQALAKSMDASGSQPISLEIRPYFSLLGQETSAVQVTSQIFGGSGAVTGSIRTGQAQSTQATGHVGANASALQDGRPRHSPRDLQALFRSLVSPDQAVQANLAGENELPEGHVLDVKATAELLEKLKAWNPDNSSHEANLRLQRGLQVLAPYIAHSDGEFFWNLVKANEHGGELGEALTSLDLLQKREAWSDLRSTLGQDDRFDATKPWLCRERFKGHDGKQEPLNGYVRIPKGKFTIGHSEQNDNKPDTIEIASDFFMARHLTTVAQYAHFVAGDGYKNKDLWDAQGWKWLENKWSSEIENKAWRAHLDSRPPELRQQPMRWQEQLPHASRPVHGVSWFEARAYARWLHEQLKSEPGFPTGGYAASLPTEAQWERAARAQAGGGAHKEAWVLGAEGKSPEIKANIDGSKIGRASVVGLFAPNPLGLVDIAGNLWEWQDNLYDSERKFANQRIKRNADLRTAKEWQNSDRPGLRGGSWIYPAVSAQASFRVRGQPGYWRYDVGFRVVLSLAI